MNLHVNIDEINREAWNSADARRKLTMDMRWTDRGEQAALEWVTEEARHRPILDIGVGPGRTVPLLRAVSNDYIGIDYTAKLLDLCRSRHPGVDLRHMDARDLSGFADASFSLVVFSFNGIDCVDYGDRVLILKEIHRVLEPGGLVLFSSHNKDGPGHRENIWQFLPRFTLNPIKLGWRTLRTIRTMPLATYNYLRNSKLNREFDGYSVRNAAAHNFGIVIVYTSVKEQLRQLKEVGFTTEAVFDSSKGAPVVDGQETSDVWWFHFIARKPQAQ